MICQRGGIFRICRIFMENFVLFCARIIKCNEDFLVRMTALWKNVKNSLRFDPFPPFIQFLESPSVPILPHDPRTWLLLISQQSSARKGRWLYRFAQGILISWKNWAQLNRWRVKLLLQNNNKSITEESAQEIWWKIISNDRHSIFQKKEISAKY